VPWLPVLQIALAAALAACGGGAVASRGSEEAGSPAAGSPSAAPSQLDPSASGIVAACGQAISVKLHQAPTLEAQLPATIAGRTLSRWSVRGRCALELLLSGTPRSVDELLLEAETPGTPALDIDAVQYAIAGRSDVANHPPYFVFAAARPDDEDEIGLNLFVLLGGGSFVDPAAVGAAAELDGFEDAGIPGKDVFVGSADLLKQTEHQRGRPYLYQTDDAMFLVVTDDEAWAAEAFSKLP
jgi:hypothetical protein